MKLLHDVTKLWFLAALLLAICLLKLMLRLAEHAQGNYFRYNVLLSVS